MADFFTYFLMFSVVAVFVIAFRGFYKLSVKKQNEKHIKSRLKTQKTEDGGIDFVRCPMCNTPLAKNEDMTSRIFHPMNTPDQRMTVMGCPHCYPQPEKGVKRICPVCKKDVPLDGYLIARLFNRTSQKKHVMITGCTQCYGPKKKS